MKKIIFICLTLLFVINVNAQLSNKHWIPPLHANENFTDQQNQLLIQDHYIYLSTPEPTAFQVTVTNGSGTPIPGSPFTISQGNPVEIQIGSQQPSVMFVENNEVGSVIQGKGLILEGVYDFYVSFRVRSSAHAEFLASKGKTGAGTVFRLGSLPQYYDSVIRNFVSSFMATEDNTTVNLSGYNPNVTFIINGNPTTTPSQSFTLNKGESVVVSGNCDSPALSANFEGFIGALLTSDKPIVVNTGNLAGGTEPSSTGNSKQDFNLDQIVPLEQVGTEYIIMKGNGSSNTEIPLIIAHEDNTEIYLNGNATPLTTLNAGEYILVPSSNFQGTGANQNMYINSVDKPIFLYQIVGGDPNNDATNGFYFIPPLNCYWQKSVDLIPNINSIGWDNSYSSDLILATEAGATVKINNVTTNAIPLIVAGNPSWESYRISGLTGNVKIESTGPLAVGVFGASGNAGIGGYFSGFGATPKDITIDVCTGLIVDLFDKIPGNPEPGGEWYFENISNAPRANGGLFDPSVDPIGNYIYVFEKQCPGQPPLPLDVTVTINSIQPGPNAGVSTSKSYCINDTTEDLTSLLGTNITSGGNWTYNNTPRSNGIIDPSVDQSGTYTYTIPAQGVCDAVSASITVTINSSPILENVTNLEECDDSVLNVSTDTDGISVFNLISKNNEVIGTQTNVTVKYYLQQDDAENETNNNITSIRATTGTTIFFRIENDLGCFQVGSFNLIVNPLPITPSEVTLKQCDTDTDAITSFNLTQANILIDNTSSDYTFSYHNNQFGAENNTNFVSDEINHIASNGTVVWSRIETNEGCYRVCKVNLVVSATTIPQTYFYEIFECDEYLSINDPDKDGFDYFNLTLIEQQLTAFFPSNQSYTFDYYLNEDDAINELNPILDFTNYRNIVPNNQTIWIRMESTLHECAALGPFLKLTVDKIPDIDLGVNFTLCLNPVNGTGSQIIDATPTNSGTFSYIWSTDVPGLDLSGETNAQYDVTAAGTYSVLVTNTITGCENSDSITATFSSEPATFEASITTEPFEAGLSTIIGIASGGYGIYEYSLDLINWQSSPIFNNVSNGNHTIYVRDIQGCGILSVTNLIAITYPNFFTPNGDGYNDTWNIANLPQEYNAKLYIFDRYGRLIKQISPNGNGWNGTFNGEALPSSDYWFTLEYTINNEQKEFKSHFSLKR